jgi:hypothetical protein
MVERDNQEDKQENISALGLSPFKSAIFMTLWIAALIKIIYQKRQLVVCHLPLL